jgi:hypothetical protein
VGAIVLADPFDCCLGGLAGEDGQPSQSCTCASVPSETSDLNPLASSCTAKEISEDWNEARRICRQAEVRPVEMVMLPRGSPSWIEVETEVGRLLATVGIIGVVGNSYHVGAVGKPDRCPVNVGTAPWNPVNVPGPFTGDGGDSVIALRLALEAVAIDVYRELDVNAYRTGDRDHPTRRAAVERSLRQSQSPQVKTGDFTLE